MIRASVLALLFSAAGFFISESSLGPLGSYGKLFDRGTRIIGSTLSVSKKKQQISAAQSPLFFAGHNEERPLIPPAVSEFLQAYSLSQYENAFLDGIRFGQFKRVAGEIYRYTGYELIRLDTIPDFIRKIYMVLSYPLGPEKRISHFLFWRPLFRINKFYYSYKGHDIFLLQKKLAALDLYDQRVKGVVNTELLYAVVQFQKQMDLEITGFPDDKTVFLVCQLASQSDISLKEDTAAF